VDEAGLLCAFCDELVVAADPELLEGDDVVAAWSACCGLVAGVRVVRGAVPRLRVCRVGDPVCDGLEALLALVGDDPEAPVRARGREGGELDEARRRGGTRTGGRTHQQLSERTLRLCGGSALSMARVDGSERADEEDEAPLVRRPPPRCSLDTSHRATASVCTEP